MPRTILESYINYAYLSVRLSEIKGLNPTLGSTLSKAAATSLSTILVTWGVRIILEYFP